MSHFVPFRNVHCVTSLRAVTFSSEVFQLLRRAARTFWLALTVCGITGLWAAQGPAGSSVAAQSIRIDAVPVPLNPKDPSATAIGDFLYAGGLLLSSKQTDRFREISDIVVTGQDRLIAVGDGGIVFNARLVFDAAQRLTGIADASWAPLVGEDGKPLAGQSRIDAEGLAILANGDRLVSFERDHRIWLYPTVGTMPRSVPSPAANLPSNFGMEAIAADPTVAPDAYVVGEEMTGKTWTCRLTMACVEGITVEKPGEFGLVAMNRLGKDTMAYLLRAYDPLRGVRIMLRIVRSTSVMAQMDMALPLTVDNFEGLASVPSPNGSTRFYLMSDDNGSSTQRTLILAFDWKPK
jgi:hypothetical protein